MCKTKKAGLQLWPLAWGAKWPRLSQPTQRKDWKHNQHLILIWNSLVCTENLTWTHFEMFSIQRLERFNMTEINYEVRSLDGYSNWDGSNKSFHGVWWIVYPPKELNQLYFNRYSFLDTAAALLCAAQHRPFSNSSLFNSIICWMSDRNLISFYLTE